jgi:hypothetical protein
VLVLGFGVVVPLLSLAWLAVSNRDIGMQVLLVAASSCSLALATHHVRRRLRRPVTRFDALLAGWLASALVVAIPVGSLFTFLALVQILVEPWQGVIGMLALACLPIAAVVAIGFEAWSAFAATRALRSPLRAAGILAPLALAFLLHVPLAMWAHGVESDVLDGTRPIEHASLERWRVIAPDRTWSELRHQHDLALRAGPFERVQRLAAAYEALTGRSIHGVR